MKSQVGTACEIASLRDEGEERMELSPDEGDGAMLERQEFVGSGQWSLMGGSSRDLR